MFSGRPRIAVGTLAVLAVVGGAAVAVPALAAPSSAEQTTAPAVKRQGVTQTQVLSAETALKIADAVMREAAREKQRVTVAIVDRSGATRLILKGDGAGPQTEESAKRKAFTAVSFGRPTSELGKGIGGGGPSIADIPGTLMLAGGIPVAVNGSPIAGIGVGGAPSGDIDERLAQAGLRAAGQLG
ncbi:GlcG/HbpS family heme-binding protein [Rhizohabitans arisaemae]|uniref:GlcG/HbpS family heme-binding protein n=1 Tax=Rhizohabitans arisaemae TaxID=2720610 RepID=UPI0024B18B4E|nr:heme-binding protein [Rhizohabitans arisaemae]